MSLWYEGYLAFDIKPDAPGKIITTLEYLTRIEDYSFEDFPSHEFFSTNGWRNFLQIETEPSGVPGLFWSDFRFITRSIHRDKVISRHTLSFRRVMHDDVEFNILWWNFLFWIAPYVETKGFIGFYRETYSLHPEIIYMSNGKIFTKEIKSNPKGWRHGEAWNSVFDESQDNLPEWLKGN